MIRDTSTVPSFFQRNSRIKLSKNKAPSNFRATKKPNLVADHQFIRHHGDCFNVGTKLSSNLKSQKFQEPPAFRLLELRPRLSRGDKLSEISITVNRIFKISFCRTFLAFASSAPLFQTGRRNYQTFRIRQKLFSNILPVALETSWILDLQPEIFFAFDIRTPAFQAGHRFSPGIKTLKRDHEPVFSLVTPFSTHPSPAFSDSIPLCIEIRHMIKGDPHRGRLSRCMSPSEIDRIFPVSLVEAVHQFVEFTPRLLPAE
jgi:hypothetical protein